MWLGLDRPLLGNYLSNLQHCHVLDIFMSLQLGGLVLVGSTYHYLN